MPTRLLVATTLFLLTLSSRAEAQTPALEVENSGGTTLFQVNTDGSIQLVPQGAAAGLVLTATDATGNAAWQAGTGLVLPFSGTHNQISPAFSLTKNAGGDVLSLSNTAGGRLLFGSMTGGVPGSMALRLLSSHGGLQMEAGNGFGVNVSNTSASATLRAVNSGSGAAGRFEGDVEITGSVDCTGCIDGNDVGVNSVGGIRIMDESLTGADVADGTLTGSDVQNGSLTPADVDATSGFYVSKSQLYVEETSFSIPNGFTGFGDAACRDVNDLPLSGGCTTPSSGDVFVRYATPQNWTSTTERAEYLCTVTNRSGGTVQATTRIVCLDVN